MPYSKLYTSKQNSLVIDKKVYVMTLSHDTQDKADPENARLILEGIDEKTNEHFMHSYIMNATKKPPQFEIDKKFGIEKLLGKDYFAYSFQLTLDEEKQIEKKISELNRWGQVAP
jgi:hypothetical protein